MSALDVGQLVVLVIQIACYSFAFIAFPIILRRNSRRHWRDMEERHQEWMRRRVVAEGGQEAT